MTSNMSDSQKLDFLINAVSPLPEIKANLQVMVARVAVLEATVEAQQKVITSLQSEVRALQISDNNREQERRNTSLRLFNFPGSNSETGLAKKVYDKLLKPILKAAHAKGEIPTTPQMDSVIEDIFRAGKFADGANKPPPPIIIKFASPSYRKAILLYKRNNTPPSDGPKKKILTEDLTHPTHRKMKELLNDERVAKVWSRSGTLWVVKAGENAVAKPVKSVFNSIDVILR